jgi:hypothetical protein
MKMMPGDKMKDMKKGPKVESKFRSEAEIQKLTSSRRP